MDEEPIVLAVECVLVSSYGDVGTVLLALFMVGSRVDVFFGYSYFYVRWFSTCFGWQANIVEDYVLLSASSFV